ncbi:MAG: flagellar export protein FliJ [Alphaproteobacteria bacterium]|nr:flagellar export protein FliJ [Rhodobiaceae bacterium]MBO6543756.1 flagellar export protein FliJ [Alphaproteobacteria bacterium]MBO6629583.1 flagellar export protein FliJ [Alphaproteobacteria bacterium]MDF1626651.1 flagellar export protein FliJ [Parvibaculaceae bacterium]
MKNKETLIRLHRFQVDERRRQVADLEAMLEEFRRKETDLNRQVQIEQDKAGISDIGHYAYPMFAKSMLARRENLLHSIDNISRQLAEAKEYLADSYRDLKKYELIEENRKRRAKKEAVRLEQKELDEVSLNIHRKTDIAVEKR